MRLLLIVSSLIVFLNAELKVFSEDLPPFSYNGNLNNPTGIAVEIVRKILENNKQKSGIKIMNFSKAFELVKNHDDSILFPVSRTKKREKLFKWVGPLFKSKSYLYKLKNNNKTYNQKGKNAKGIAVVKNYASTRALIDQEYSNLVVSSHTSQALRLLLNKRVELADIGEMFLPFRAKQAKVDHKKIVNTGIMILLHKQYIAFNKNIPDDVIQKWQDELDRLKQNGTYDSIFKKEYKKALKVFDIE